MDLNAVINKNKNTIINIAVIVVALIIAQKIYGSQMRVVETLKSQKEAEIKKNEVLANIVQSENKINAYKNLINTKEVTSLMNHISDIARDSEVKILSIEPASEIDAGAYINKSFHLSIKTQDYHKIGEFIAKLENSPDIYMINDLNINAGRNTINKDKDNVSAQITVSTMLLKD